MNELPNGTAKAVVNSLERDAARARKLGLALLFLGVVCMIAAAIFSGYTAFKVKEQTTFNERLSKSIADYQFDHAKQSQESFLQLQDSLRCVNLEFAKANIGLDAIDPEAIAACFRPPPAAPPPPTDTRKDGP